MGCSPQGGKELDTTEATEHAHIIKWIQEGTNWSPQRQSNLLMVAQQVIGQAKLRIQGI